ncbi:MAG: hypothetical protein ACE5ID_02880 [Acidobacteriota bacterium]
MERDYAPKGVKFYYIYKALAHPEYHHYVMPFTLKERLMHVREAKRTLGSEIPWVCDGMDNKVKHALGGMPNAEFIVGPDGLVVERRVWSSPDKLRENLAALVGPVEHPTRIEDLHLPTLPPPQSVARNIVPPLEVQHPMRAVKIKPDLHDAKMPFYVKLRAEVDSDFQETGTGQMYLGFHLDPLYHVHWNNQADPLEFKVTGPASIHISPSAGQAPQVEEHADADPREFLVDLKTDSKGESGPLDLEVHYFACDDDNTFCVPVTQRYQIALKVDHDGGSAMRRWEHGKRFRSAANRR